MIKILILGGSGLLGNNMVKYFSNLDKYDVYATMRSSNYLEFFEKDIQSNIYIDIDILDDNALDKLIKKLKPDVLLNCVGITNKTKNINSDDKIKLLTLNSLFPHRLYKICSNYGVRLIHFSTDCVFSGAKGSYIETDIADSTDLYGRTKLLGELYQPGSITIRKSIIGHELIRKEGLLNWFLNQKDNVKGYDKAVFSGFPVNELAFIIEKYIIPNFDLTGLYHISSSPITKYELLKLISKIYLKRIDIIKNESIIIDRSLDSSLFSSLTGYNSKSWPDMIKSMYRFNQVMKNV